jgi:CRP/FNR family transcriptional regulator
MHATMAEPLADLRPEEVCPTCGARERAVCGVLTGPELRALSKAGHRRTLARGQTLVWAGDEAAACANVVAGVLKITAVDAGGRERIAGLLYPGDFIGHPFGGRELHTVTAASDAELCVFARADFAAALGRFHHMAGALLQRTLDALDASRLANLMIGQTSARARVAGFLSDLAARAPGAGCAGAPVGLPVTRGEMAELLGLTIETVSRQMTALRGERVIETPSLKTFLVLDPAALARAAEG